MSVFANLKNSLPPLMPDPSQGPLLTMPDDSGAAQTQLQKISASVPKPSVVFAPTPQQQIQDHLQGNLNRDYQKDLHPWGTEGNHPGVFGKIMHGLNVATGGETRRGWEEQGLEKRLNDLASENAKNEYTSAETGKTREGTAEMPGAERSKESLESAQEANLRGEEETREHPPEDWKAITGIIGPNGEPVEIETRSGNVRFGGVQGAQQVHAPKPDTPEQQYIDEYQRLHKGATVAEAERAYTADTQKPPQQIMLIPGANGGYTAQNIRPGSQVAPGAITATQEGSQQIPTSQMRNMGEMAATIQPQMDLVKQEVRSLAQSLGPAVGRWNQFMVNNGGTDYPEFAGLDTDLDLLASAIVRTHFGARGGQGYREELRKHFGEAQSPEDLINRIQHAEGWIKGYAAAGGVKDKGGNGQESPSSGRVFDSARWAQANPKGDVEAAKKQAKAEGYEVK